MNAPARRNLQCAGLVAALLSGCAELPVDDEEEITFSDSWFSCDSRFQCIAVQDSFCNLTAVNRNYAIIFQDWSRQQVEKMGERVPCPRLDPDFPPPAARCASGRCTYPFGRSPDKPE